MSPSTSQSSSRQMSPKPKKSCPVKRFFKKLGCPCGKSCSTKCPVCEFVKEHKKQFLAGLAIFILYMAAAMTIDYRNSKAPAKPEEPVEQPAQQEQPAEEEKPTEPEEPVEPEANQETPPPEETKPQDQNAQ